MTPNRVDTMEVTGVTQWVVSWVCICRCMLGVSGDAGNGKWSLEPKWLNSGRGSNISQSTEPKFVEGPRSSQVQVTWWHLTATLPTEVP